MKKRRAFQNSKAGVSFLQIWQEKGRADARAAVEKRNGRVPTGDRKYGMRGGGWADQAYTDGFNAELRRLRLERQPLDIGKVFGG